MHSLDWDITTEYNLDISSQSLNFILFNNSVWQDKESCNFEDGTSFTVNFLTLKGQYLTLLAMSKHYITRRYRLRNDGYIAGTDLDLKPFTLTTDNVAVFVRGKYVRPTCYTATDQSIRFHIKGEKKPGTTELKDYTSWSEGDIVTFITNDPSAPEEKFYSYYLEYTSNPSAMVLSQNGIHFRSAATPRLNRGKIIVMVNGEIIPYKELTFPGGDKAEVYDSNRQQALVIKRNLSEADKVEILYFDEDFEHFEYAPQSGQTRFQSPDLYGNYLSYSAEEGAGIAQLFEYSFDDAGNLIHNGVPWSNITGVNNGCRLHASCVYNGQSYIGEAEIQDVIMDKSYVKVKILSDFGRKEFDSSEWYITPALSKSIVSYLDPRTQDTIAYPEILQSFQLFFLDYYQDGIRRLTHLRNVNEVEPELLMPTLDMLGMRLDMSKMSELNKRRAVKEVINFYKRCGTRQSINFLGYINDKVINMEDALWTDDYVHFSTPAELGATYERRQLAQFIDYRFIAATPVYTEDYGDCLDLKKPFVVTAEGTTVSVKFGSRAFFPNHYTGTEGSMKWNLIPERLDITSDDYAAGDFFLIVLDDHGKQSLDLVENIPTLTIEDIDPERSMYYYDETFNSINLSSDLEVSISAPLAKIHIDVNDFTMTVLQTYQTCSFVDDYVFVMTSNPIIEPNTGAKLQTGVSFAYQSIDDEGYVVDHKVELSKSQRFSIKNARGKNFLAFFNKSSDPASLSSSNLDYLPEQFYTGTGILPEVANRALWRLGKEWFVYDNYAVGPDKFECTLDEEGKVTRDESGLAIVKYTVKDAWYKCVYIGEYESLPTVGSLAEINKVPTKFRAYSNTSAPLKNVYVLETSNIKVGDPVCKYADADTKVGTISAITSTTIKFNGYTYTANPSKDESGRPLCKLDGIYYVLASRQTYEGDAGREYASGTDRIYLLKQGPLVGDKAYTYNNEERQTYIITAIDEHLESVYACPIEYYGTSSQEAHSKWYTRSAVYNEETGEYDDVIVYSWYWTYERSTYWSEITRYFTDYSVAYNVKEEELSSKTFYKGIRVSGFDYDVYFPDVVPTIGMNFYTKVGSIFYYSGRIKNVSGSTATLLPDETYTLADSGKGNYVLMNQQFVDPLTMKVYVGKKKWNIITVDEQTSENLSTVGFRYVSKNGQDNNATIIETKSGTNITYSINKSGSLVDILTIEENDPHYYYIFVYGTRYTVMTSDVELREFDCNKKAFEFFPIDSEVRDVYITLLERETVYSSVKWCLRFGNGTYGLIPSDGQTLTVNYNQGIYTVDTVHEYPGNYFGEVEGSHNAWSRYSVHLLNKEQKAPSYIVYEIVGEEGHLKPFIPYFNQEIYFDGVNMQHYQFKNGVWNKVSMVVVGEFIRGGKTSDSGHNYEDTFISTGETGKRYYLKHQSLINTKSFQITVDDIEWTVIYQGLDAEGADSRVALLTKDTAGNWYAIFGDNVHGKKPDANVPIVITYSNYPFPIMDKFLPYEKMYSDIHKTDHKIGYIKTAARTWVINTELEDPIPSTGYRFEDFVNPEGIDVSSMSIFVNGVQWAIVSNKNKYGPYDRVAEVKSTRTKHGCFVYVLFGNNVHGKNLQKGDLIEIYYKRDGDDYINNHWYMNYSTFQHSLNTRVAYDYGLITQSKESEWVYYRVFDPPVGYYPTNHVRFNINANGVVDASDFESEARYQFYELASTPWVLENVCNVIEFSNFWIGVGAVSKEVGSLFFRATDTLGRISMQLTHDDSSIAAFNTSLDENIYLVRNGELGELTGIREIKFLIPYVDEWGVEHKYLVFTKQNDPYKKYAVSIDDVPAIKPRQTFSFKEGDVLYAPKGVVIDTTISTPDRDTIYMTMDFNSNTNPIAISDFTKVCNLKVNVTSDNSRAEDKIELYALGQQIVSGTVLSFLMCEGKKMKVNLLAKQRGCTDVVKELDLDINMFNNATSTIEETLQLKRYNVNLVFVGPDPSCQVNVNGTLYNSGSTVTVKYGTSITAYAVGAKYLAASSMQIINFVALNDDIYYLQLNIKYHRLKVTTTVGGVQNTNQPIYLNGMANTVDAIWQLGEVVTIVAGGELNNTRVVSKSFTILDDDSRNVVNIECPKLTDSDIDCAMLS